MSRRPVHLSTWADAGAVGLLIALAIALAALTTASASANPGPGTSGVKRGQAAGPIYFWANLGYPVKTPVHGFPNPPVIRPSTFTIFEDGSWEIEKLHWTGWGSPVAEATGKSNADTDHPNVAEGKRIITPAKVILYDPGTFGGRRVYRCIRIKLRKPANFPTSCLQRTGNSVDLSPPGTGIPVGNEGAGEGVRHVDEFFSPGRRIWCQISTILAQASCGTYPEPPTHSAVVTKTGKVEICSVEKLEYPGAGHGPPAGCYQNWPPGGLPILHIGEATSVGGFRCSSEAGGITCVKFSGPGKGAGFRIDAQEAVELSPAAQRTISVRTALGRRRAGSRLARAERG